MSPLDHEQIGHIARLAILGMCARGVAASEFETTPEVRKMVITVHCHDSDATGASELPVDVEFYGSHSIPVGGLSI